MENIWGMAFYDAMSVINVALVFLGVLLGIIIGALPGLGAAIGLTLIMPVTFGMPPTSALIMAGGLYMGAIYGGSISSILLNIPGDPTSSATILDGFPMSQQGKSAEALAASTTASFIGGIFGVLLLMFLAPPIARIALRFGAAEQFMLAIFGLSVIAVAAKGAMTRGLIAGFLGLAVSSIGYDLITGHERFTFGNVYLSDGIEFIPAVTGIFGLSQVMIMAKEGRSISEVGELVGNLWDGIKAVFVKWVVTLRSALIGAFLGTIPGVGGTTSNFIAYLASLQMSKNPESFGKGNIEGVISPEASNNATVGTSLIPTLIFGVPGSAAAAVFMGFLTIHGLAPGARMFTDNVLITYTFFWGLLFSNIALILIALLLCKYLIKVTLLPSQILIVLVTVLCVLGAFSVRNMMFDVYVCLAFGILGYFFRQYGFPPVCFVLGLILGPIAERNLSRAFIISGQNYSFLYERPITLSIIIITILLLLVPYARDMYENYKQKTKSS